MKHAEIFASRLRMLEARDGLTTVQVAKLTGITASSIYSMERGETQPRFGSLIAIAKLFNVTTDYLCGLTTEQTTS